VQRGSVVGTAGFVGEQAQQLRWHTDQLPLPHKAHIDHTRAPAEDLTSLMQPRKPRPGLEGLGDLLNPAKEGNRDTVDIAPLVLDRPRFLSGHGASHLRGWLVAGWPPGAEHWGPLADQPRASRRSQGWRLADWGRADRGTAGITGGMVGWCGVWEGW
jgi:hypothetical protein